MQVCRRGEPANAEPTRPGPFRLSAIDQNQTGWFEAGGESEQGHSGVGLEYAAVSDVDPLPRGLDGLFSSWCFGGKQGHEAILAQLAEDGHSVSPVAVRSRDRQGLK